MHVRLLGAACAAATLACAGGPAFTSGPDAVTACAVRPLPEWLGDATVVSTVCGPSLGIGTHRFYVHVRTSREPVLIGAERVTAALDSQRGGTAYHLRDRSPERRSELVKLLTTHGMKAPPRDAAHAMWDLSVFANPAWQSWVETLRSGDDVWITAELGGGS